MKPSRRPASVFLNLILFAGLVAVWIAFAPTRIGGQASYVMVNGISMEPNYHTGDLVIVRKAQAYQVGDVVTYRDAEMGAYVIHRIIGIEQGRYILQGDNNSWIDAYHPTHDEIAGRQWVHALQLGKAMQWLRTPIHMALSIVLLGGVFMASTLTKSPKGAKGKTRPSVNPNGMLEGTLYLLGVIFLGFIGLSIFAFTRPLTRNADGITYQQESNYLYSATGTPGVYDTGTVRSGEPVFPKLTCFLNIGFTYNIPGSQLQDVAGSHQMYARVMDEQSGWQRTLPLLPQAAFNGSSYVTMAALDLCQLESLVNLVEKETGLHANVYTVEIVSNIAITARVAGQTITDTFEPTLVFKFDKVHLYLADNEDTMKTVKPGLVGSSNLQANTLPLLGWEPTVGSIRTFALLGMGISLIGLALMGLFVFNTARQSEEALIRLRYGALLMDVYERSLDASLPVIDVTSIDDLARLAERQNTMIMHMTLNFLHFYLVQGNGAIYRYLSSSGKRGLSADEPGGQEVTGFLGGSEEFAYAPIHPARQETAGYVINIEPSRAAEPSPAETAFLRKIRI
jgi:signal peptidase